MNPMKYNQRFEWLQRSSFIDSLTGEHKEVFTPNGKLWGYVQFTGGGNESDDYGRRVEIVNATIYINQWPAITNLDRLKDIRFGDTWYIDAVIRNFKPIELQLQATRKPPETDNRGDWARPFAGAFSGGFA